MDVLITVCGEVNELTLQSTLTAPSIWDRKVCVYMCVWVCARVYQEMEKLIRPEVLIKA